MLSFSLSFSLLLVLPGHRVPESAVFYPQATGRSHGPVLCTGCRRHRRRCRRWAKRTCPGLGWAGQSYPCSSKNYDGPGARGRWRCRSCPRW
ncbi:hypothetical protein F5Y03DRAFT_358959 [Xylaria venustula]|nr:hypothetical protein F5Y03DRAFT_358959 [Xylaria venustula]